MRIFRKIFATTVAAFVSAGAFAFDASQFTDSLDKYDETVATINDGLLDFSKQLANAIPQAATQQNVWADAYIGKLFPSAKPHFGGGFNMGVTHIDTSGVAKAADALGIGGIKDNYYYPVFTADLRIGGLLLPFDVDIAVMKTGTLSTDAFGCDLNVDFLTIGADFRYSLLEEGIILPGISAGVGYFYNQGSFGAGNDDAELAIDYKVHTMYVQAQVSKKLLIFTPFLGIRGIVSKYDNAYSWKIKNSTVVSAINALGKTSSGADSYTSDAFDFNAIQPQVYAGIGFNLLFMQATLSISADLRNVWDDGLWSGSFSLRAKL
ncbi:MAG: hypothetical protein IKP49_11050 [Treponema sp.]|nr:hypothetical protein [Treponema sp.]